MAGMPLFAHAGREKLTRSAGGGRRAGGAEELRSNRRLLVVYCMTAGWGATEVHWMLRPGAL